MKSLKCIVSNVISGIGVGFIGKVFLENILGLGSQSQEGFYATQVIFLVTSVIGGLSFTWMEVEFKKGIHQYLAVIITYFVGSNLSYAMFIRIYSLGDYITTFIFMNVFWLIVCTIIYLVIIWYYHILAKELNEELTREINKKS